MKRNGLYVIYLHAMSCDHPSRILCVCVQGLGTRVKCTHCAHCAHCTHCTVFNTSRVYSEYIRYMCIVHVYNIHCYNKHTIVCVICRCMRSIVHYNIL